MALSLRTPGAYDLTASLSRQYSRTSDPRRISRAEDGNCYLAVPTAEEDLSPTRRSSTFAVVEVAELEGRPCGFVEAGWFQALSALVVVGNVVAMVLAAGRSSFDSRIYWAEQGALLFYIWELLCRGCRFRRGLFCGPWTVVSWNWLDLVIVAAGVSDQFGRSFKSCHLTLSFLRLLRLLRVLKILRILLESDLSWTENPLFQSFIGTVILINAVLMGMETDRPNWYGWSYIEQVLLCIYVFELSVRLKRYGEFFFSCENSDLGWNLLDFSIVATSAGDTWGVPLCRTVYAYVAHDGHYDPEIDKHAQIGQVVILMRMLRLMRILRLIRLFKSVRPLFNLVTGLVSAIQGVVWVLVLTLTVLYAMGIVATRLIGHGLLFPDGQPPDDIFMPFKSVPESMFTLFRVMSGEPSEEESIAIDKLMAALPAVKFCFVFFMITSSWTLLSLITAVVSENMIRTTSEQEAEFRIHGAEEERERMRAALTETFRVIDSNGDGTICSSELDEFLEETENAVRTTTRCRAPPRDIKDMLEMLGELHETVTMETFIERLLDVSTVATEKSILKLEVQLKRQAEAVEDLREFLERKFGDPTPTKTTSMSLGAQRRKSLLERCGPDDTGTLALIEARHAENRHCLDGLLRASEVLKATAEMEEAMSAHGDRVGHSPALSAGLAADALRKHSAAVRRVMCELEVALSQLQRDRLPSNSDAATRTAAATAMQREPPTLRGSAEGDCGRDVRVFALSPGAIAPNRCATFSEG